MSVTIVFADPGTTLPSPLQWICDAFDGKAFQILGPDGRTYLSGILRVNPTSAEVALQQHNRQNRPVRQSGVEKLQKVLLTNQWILNGETGIFDESGDIDSFQHRLMACVASGVPFDTFFVAGTSTQGYASLDAGQMRTLADFLAQMGEDLPKLKAAATVFLINFFQTGTIRSGPPNQIMTRKDELDFFAQHAGQVGLFPTVGIRLSARFTSGKQDCYRMFGGAGQVIALHYLFSRVSLCQANRFFTFFTDFICHPEPGWQVAPPLLTRLAKNGAEGSALLEDREILALTILAWNTILKKGNIKRLTWSLGDPFPEIAGWTYHEGKPVTAQIAEPPTHEDFDV